MTFLCRARYVPYLLTDAVDPYRQEYYNQRSHVYKDIVLGYVKSIPDLTAFSLLDVLVNVVNSQNVLDSAITFLGRTPIYNLNLQDKCAVMDMISRQSPIMRYTQLKTCGVLPIANERIRLFQNYIFR